MSPANASREERSGAVSEANDACHIYFAGPIDSEYGPPMMRVVGTLGTLNQEFFEAQREGRMMAVTSYRLNRATGELDEMFPMLVNPSRIETINYASKGDRRALGWVEEANAHAA